MFINLEKWRKTCWFSQGHKKTKTTKLKLGILGTKAVDTFMGILIKQADLCVT